MQYPQLGRAAFGALLALTGIGAQAADAQSPWQLRAGLSNVVPTSSPGSIAAGAFNVDIDNQYTPTFNIAYFLSDNVAIDVLGGLPPKHDIKLNGTKSASTRHLPPILSVQYHFAPQATIRPYVGVGINYTNFISEKFDAGGKLKLSDSWGLAAQVGVDYALNQHWTVGADVRYADIDTDVSLNGTKLGNVDVNPTIYTVNVGYRF